MNKFEQLGLNESLLLAIKDLGFENPSEVQEKAIPVLLEQDTDLVALAQTGTGKTAAFGFPLIQKIDAENRSTQALILSPTRELCLQITNEIKQYSKYVNGLHTVAIYGGASITEQAREIKRGAQIIVATPGRMQDMINRGLVNIKNINYCILDEADEMLNMGFYEDIVSILSDTPDDKSTWLFSATMPAEVARIAKKFMHEPAEVTVGTKNSGSATVSHEFYCVNARDRYEALKRLADANPDIFSVVFCRTKRDTQAVAEKLIEDGYSAAALHGDLSQAQRDGVMKSFRGRQIQMLVATDVAARGIDVDNIIAYYKKKRDLSGEKGDRSERGSEPREIRAGDPVRYFVNIGSRDDFDWMQLKDFLKETLELGRDDVFKVDVKEGFSFFNTDGEHTDKVMSILNGFSLNGRRINVEISKNEGSGPSSGRRDHNGRSSGGGFGGGRSTGGGGFGRERSSAPRGGGSGFGPRKESGFGGRSEGRSGGFGSDRPARRSDAPKPEGFSSRAPRRSESFGDSPRPRRPRKD
jgi:hypothetical protein